MWRAFQKQEAEKAVSICLAFFFQYSSAPLPSAPTAPSFSPMCICFPSMQLVMPLFLHFPLWCDECFAYVYWVSCMSSNVKPSLAICFPICFWHEDKSVSTQNRVTCRVLPEAMRLCVKACWWMCRRSPSCYTTA